MYTLRTFTDTSEVNNSLGDYYEIVRREEAYERFSELFKEHFDIDHIADLDPTSSEETRTCYAIISTLRDTIPVYKGQKNYIMTAEGKTFCNITYKG